MKAAQDCRAHLVGAVEDLENMSKEKCVNYSDWIE